MRHFFTLTALALALMLSIATLTLCTYTRIQPTHTVAQDARQLANLIEQIAAEDGHALDDVWQLATNGNVLCMANAVEEYLVARDHDRLAGEVTGMVLKLAGQTSSWIGLSPWFIKPHLTVAKLLTGPVVNIRSGFHWKGFKIQAITCVQT